MRDDDQPNLSAMTFDDLEPRTVEVTIKGVPHVLREASADAGKKYRSAAARSARMKDGEVVGIEGVGDIEPMVLALCLFEVKGSKPDGSPALFHVPEQRILSWPDRVTGALFDRLKEISPTLDPQDTEQGLVKAIDRATRKLDKLRARNAVTANGKAKEAGADADPTATSSGCAAN